MPHYKRQPRTIAAFSAAETEIRAPFFSIGRQLLRNIRTVTIVCVYVGTTICCKGLLTLRTVSNVVNINNIAMLVSA